MIKNYFIVLYDGLTGKFDVDAVIVLPNAVYCIRSVLFYRKLYESMMASAFMISQEITINGKKYRLTLTDQVLSDVRRLKALYNAAYEDPESFDEVSSAISNTITQIASAVEPLVSDSDLDGLIQAVMKAVDEKSKETEEAKVKHMEYKAKSSKKSIQKPKKSKK